MYEQISCRVEDPVAILTLDRPERLNAWTLQMAAEVRHAVARAEADERVVAIVLTGAGRGFCSGADLEDLRALGDGGAPAKVPDGLDAEPGDPDLEDFRGTYTYLMSVRKPVIAAVNGPCAGMALPIVLACDLRFASDRAFFKTAFAQRGLVAEWGTAWLLPRLVGPAHALDLLFSARRVAADEAERIGLVNRVLPHEELMSFVQGYVGELAANSSPTSMRIMKRQVYEQLCQPLGPAEREAFDLMTRSFGHPDFKEGVEAFLAHRPPRFQRI